jgi:hypothetical protein
MPMVVRDEGWDFMVSDRHHRMVLGVEVKGQLGKSPEWVAEFRRNMLAHEMSVLTPYFMIAMPDYVHLWVKADQPESPADPWYRLPDYTIAAESLWRPYLGYLGGDIAQLGKPEFEFVVGSFLRDLLNPSGQAEFEAATADWLRSSGLFDAIVAGRLLVEEMV